MELIRNNLDFVLKHGNDTILEYNSKKPMIYVGFGKENVDMYLFYGSDFTDYLDKVKIWDEMEEYLILWKNSQDNKIELNFEENWEETKKELLKFVPVKNWKKIIKNKKVIEEVMPILFPTERYKEILQELKINTN